jgi:cell division protease FtsH
MTDGVSQEPLIIHHSPMSILIPERELPEELTAEQAVEGAYASELAEIASDLQRSLPVLVECDKDLAPFLFLNVRGRLKQAALRCLYLDGRPREGQQADPMGGFVGTMLAQLREAVRGAPRGGAAAFGPLDHQPRRLDARGPRSHPPAL